MSAPLLKAREVGEMLGMSTAWVLDQWEAGKLPGFRLSSRAVRFSEAEIQAWLEGRRGNPQDSFVAIDRTES
jgi:predicted DNA-binding transcriptional regulator AlpA